MWLFITTSVSLFSLISCGRLQGARCEYCKRLKQTKVLLHTFQYIIYPGILLVHTGLYIGDLGEPH